MSDPVTSSTRVTQAETQGMITLRGELKSADFSAALDAESGCPLPEAGQIVTKGAHSLGWMSPDELLLLCPHADALALAKALSAALDGQFALAANVSEARAVFDLTGPGLRDVLAKLTPADCRPAALPVGTFRRSRLAQVAAAFWLESETHARVICFRSASRYMQDLLNAAAAPDAQVGHLSTG